jgi:hypothetical protein
MSRRQGRYVALYHRSPELGGNYFRVVDIDFPAGMIPPPTLRMHVPLSGTHDFVWAPTQDDAAQAFSTSQQNVSRWMRNDTPELTS